MIYLGLGGNVGDDAAILARFTAVAEALASWGPVDTSSVYRTAPIGPDQPAFLNAALGVDALDEPSPATVWWTIHDLERAHGRDRAREDRWGPRTLDIDLLLWDGHDGRWPIDDHTLDVPHPRLLVRRFALQPLTDLLDPRTLVAARPLSDWLQDVLDQHVLPTTLRF